MDTSLGVRSFVNDGDYLMHTRTNCIGLREMLAGNVGGRSIATTLELLLVTVIMSMLRSKFDTSM